MSKIVEYIYPYFWPLLLAGLAFVYKDVFLTALTNGNIKFDVIFGASFTLITVLMGFIFAFYGIIVSSHSEFMQQVKKSSSYRPFLSHIWQSLFIALLFIIVDVFAWVLKDLKGLSPISFTILLCAWVFTFFTTLLTMYRVLRHLKLLLETDYVKRKRAG